MSISLRQIRLIACAVVFSICFVGMSDLLIPSTAYAVDTLKEENLCLADKTVTPNDDGSYELSLSVSTDSANEITEQPVDILLVLDTSGSMAEEVVDENEESRLRYEIAGEVVNHFVDNLIGESSGNDPSDKGDIQIGLTSFSTYAINHNFENGAVFTSDANEITKEMSKFKKLESSTWDDIFGIWDDKPTDEENKYGMCGGTNWEHALITAKKTIDSGRPDARKYIIFLTDGEPTYRVNPMGFESDGRNLYGKKTANSEWTTVQDPFDEKKTKTFKAGRVYWHNGTYTWSGFDCSYENDWNFPNGRNMVAEDSYSASDKPHIYGTGIGDYLWNTGDFEKSYRVHNPLDLSYPASFYKYAIEDKVTDDNFNHGLNYLAAKEKAEELAANDCTLCSIAIGDGSVFTRIDTFTNEINASKVNASENFRMARSFNGTDQQSLEEARENIETLIENEIFVNNVVLNDKLSPWVDFQLKDDGKTLYGITYEKIDSQENVSPFENAPELIRDLENETVRWDLSGLTPEKDTTYRVKFNINLNQEGFDRMAKCARGENNCVYDRGVNSQGVADSEGIFSNDNEASTVSFDIVTKRNDKEVSSVHNKQYLPKPVISPRYSTIDIHKIWSDNPANHADEIVNYQIKKDDGNEFLSGELTSENDWKDSVIVSAGPEGHTYEVVESPILGYECTTEITGDQQVTDLPEGSTAFKMQGMTEQQAKVELTNSPIFGIQVTKHQKGHVENKLAGAGFTLYKNSHPDNFEYYDPNRDSEIVSQEQKTTSEGVCEFTNLEPGSYWLVESYVPAGYSKADTVRIDIDRSLTNDAPETKFTVTPFVRAADDSLTAQEPASMDTVDNKGVVGKLSIADEKNVTLPITGVYKNPSLMYLGLVGILASMVLSIRIARKHE